LHFQSAPERAKTRPWNRAQAPVGAPASSLPIYRLNFTTRPNRVPCRRLHGRLGTSRERRIETDCLPPKLRTARYAALPEPHETPQAHTICPARGEGTAVRRTPNGSAKADKLQETLNARSEYANDDSDGRSHHRINQYIIKEEIGRGSFGAVHLATDQFGEEFVRFVLSGHIGG